VFEIKNSIKYLKVRNSNFPTCYANVHRNIKVITEKPVSE